jgi:hypothetical protein
MCESALPDDLTSAISLGFVDQRLALKDDLALIRYHLQCRQRMVLQIGCHDSSQIQERLWLGLLSGTMRIEDLIDEQLFKHQPGHGQMASRRCEGAQLIVVISWLVGSVNKSSTGLAGLRFRWHSF